MFFLKFEIKAVLTGCFLHVSGSTSTAGLSGVHTCNLSSSSLRRDVPALAWLPPVDMGVMPGNATSTVSGLIRSDSNSLKEGVGSDRVHVSRSLLICSWATLSKLKRHSLLGPRPPASSNPYLISSGAQLMSLLFVLCLSLFFAALSIIAQAPTSVGHSSSCSPANFGFVPAQPLTNPSQV